MPRSFAVAVVYYDNSVLKHQLALFAARSADEAEGLAMHDVTAQGGELVSLLSFPAPLSAGRLDQTVSPEWLSSIA